MSIGNIPPEDAAGDASTVPEAVHVDAAAHGAVPSAGLDPAPAPEQGAASGAALASAAASVSDASARPHGRSRSGSPPVPARTALTPEEILSRLRHRITVWRALYLAQVLVLLLAGGAVLLHATFPGVVGLLLRHPAAPKVGLAIALLLLAAADIGSTITERSMARLLAVQRTGLRRVLAVLYAIPGVMLLRRLVILLCGAIWLAQLCCVLLVWFLDMVLLGALARLSEGLAEGFGTATDAVDRAFSAVTAALRRAEAAISLSPVRSVDEDEEVLLPLLARRRLTAGPADEAADQDARNAATTATGSDVSTASSCQ